MRRRGALGLGSLAFLLAAFLLWQQRPSAPLCPHPPRPEGVLEATVLHAVDGDTVEAEVRGQRERVRLIGVDTPEMQDPRPSIREMAQRAARFTRSRLVGQRVGLELDVERRDRYGRLLGYVWLDGRLFNLELLEFGHARLYTVPPNVRYVEWFRTCQRLAREARRGLWGR
ncbi:MAG: thermonuclease family protein [Armatimonadota bacterium]|nr:thermonuclease family protein [Armatimonadota bacterium]MDR7562586.1 thermonuclease family protein [Armatimonadota bacterium]MDR7568490.1 thermonuclease family protein [Armatimonadota bacterium]MDR7602869.1 thermonuclease family protein [Armatimonadota bacterium]